MANEQTVIPKRSKKVYDSYDAAIASLNNATFENGEMITSRYIGSDSREHILVAVGKETGYEIVGVPPIDQELQWEEY